MQTTTPPTTVSEHFLDPILELLPTCEHSRVCSTLPDHQWLPMVLTRVLHDCKSGRAFLQEYGPRLKVCPEVGSFFESLKSERRLRLLTEINEKVQRKLARRSSNPMLTDEALRDYAIYAGDGHWHSGRFTTRSSRRSSMPRVTSMD
jgi:hypothetical protein